MIKIVKVVVLVIMLNLLPLISLSLAVAHYNNFVIKIIYPLQGQQIQNNLIPVNGFVTDPLAEVTLNGNPVVVAENGYFQSSVYLTKGSNEIIIKAKNKDHKYISEVLFCDYI